ncbi:YgiQ family radical SAM protein [Sedimentibacter sp. zth1]|uniref:YgiQ family radical SAM protein n=1 Tax=Sedimentibacter sp. zth1 TaxID=2816908 RepID=UPI001A9142A9|nr:YgiQ family radical SAM protein [Sedimentibacter sp. zth1]QSX06180.1 YgiQ family radical SAM protein [Sedimentibacter sp. zth1]
MSFLPIDKKDLEIRGWEQCDFIFITGDAYVDHPSFGTAIISRILERFGYKVGIIAQPDWNDLDEFKRLGKPRLGFLINSGNIDSMVNHYTSMKKKRNSDAYTPGGVAGKRPDRAVIVYSNKVREAYKDSPIIIGGIEASLRRLAHYDYWTDKVRRSILLDSSADLLVYGMGEKQIIEIAESLDSGIPIEEITFIDGTVYKTKDKDRAYEPIILPTYDDVSKSKQEYANSFKIQHDNTDSLNANPLVEQYGNIYVVQNTPAKILSMQELDDVYDVDYEMTYHPIYEKDGGIPSLSEIKFSVTSVRGCFGGCSFCALNFHQGRTIQVRSHDSIIQEVEKMTHDKEFKGYIHDIGGPTANFRIPSCQKQLEHGVCKHKQCLSPVKCQNLQVDHSDYVSLLRKVRKLPNIKKVFVRSGVRYDYVMYDKSDEFIKELAEHHVSGQLRTAPEHVSNNVLKLMGKPNIEIYDKFVDKFNKVSKNLGKNQYIVPYLISSHPGSTLNDAIKLAEYIRDMGYTPEQVQDFYPTPGTLSTCMYYTGINPLTGKAVYVPKSIEERKMQRALMQYKKRENYGLVLKALQKSNRYDLIGFDKKCLIKPPKTKY